MRCHSKQQAWPRRSDTEVTAVVLRCRQPERGGKGGWDTEQADCYLISRYGTGIARQTLSP